MTITAKYSGTCTKCHGSIKAGESINWERGHGSSHVTCPEKIAPTPPDPNAIHIRGRRAYHAGQVLRHTKHGLITVVSVSKYWYSEEDSMSFGGDGEAGYVYSATCRSATDEEAALLIEREKKAAELHAAKKRLAEIREHIEKTGERPTDEQPEGEKLMDTQTIYGGGDWWVIGNGIWYVRNNGADGDNWSANNVRTGGAGAIGWRIPMDDAFAAEIRMLASKLEAK